MHRFRTVTSALALVVSMIFLTSCAFTDKVGQEVQDHVSSAGGSISVDPATGAITVTGTVGLKDMEEATIIANAIIAHNKGFSVAAKQRTHYGPTVRVVPKTVAATNPCGQRSLYRTYEVKRSSIWHRFTHWIEDCPADPPVTPVVPSTPVTIGPVNGDPIPSPASPPATILEGSDEDSAIVNAVLANADSEETDKGSGDRAVVFGNNFPGTDAQLYQCVNDAKKNVVNLVKIDGFNTKNIRLFTDQQCTKANYEKWVKWALVDGGPTGRRAFFNSSHGAEDTDANGNIVDVMVTDDMVRKNVWDASTEVTYDFWYNLLHGTSNRWLFFNDSCHSGGQTRIALMSINNRRVRSIDGSPDVQARLAKAISRSNSRIALGQLTGSVIAVCLPNELASEGPNGGVGTDDYWKARKTIAVGAVVGDYIREVNRLFKQTNESQHMTLIGVNKPLWN